jgi:hypothetical protein
MAAEVVHLVSADCPYAFHCFVCGTQVQDSQGNINPNPCKHVLFHWINEVGEYEAVNPVIQSLVDEAEDEEGDGLSPFDPEFQEACPNNSVLFFVEDNPQIQTTVVIGLWFALEDEDNGDED